MVGIFMYFLLGPLLTREVCLHTALIDLAGGFMRFTSSELDASVDLEGCSLDAFVERLPRSEEAHVVVERRLGARVK